VAYLISAKGAAVSASLGHRPRNSIVTNPESFRGSQFSRWFSRSQTEVNRAFSAYVVLGFHNPGALSQAGGETAPLALDRCFGSKVLGSRLRCGALALDALPQDRTTKVL
jgi:hypothetical protein